MSSQTHCSFCKKHLRGHGIWCGICGYLHRKCSGLAPTEQYPENFICNNCSLSTPVNETTPTVEQTAQTGDTEQRDMDQLWTNLDSYEEEIDKIYYSGTLEEPVFLTRQKKGGTKFVDTRRAMLQIFTDRKGKNDIPLKLLMILPHLILPRTKSENAGSNAIIQRRLDSLTQCMFLELYNEARAVRVSLPKQKKAERRVRFEELQ